MLVAPSVSFNRHNACNQEPELAEVHEALQAHYTGSQFVLRTWICIFVESICGFWLRVEIFRLPIAIARKGDCDLGQWSRSTAWKARLFV